MHAPTKGTPARTPAIPADKIARTIEFLENRLIDSRAKAENDPGDHRYYYLGRTDAFELAVSELREVLL